MRRISLYPHVLRWVFIAVFLLVMSEQAKSQFYAVKVDAIGLMTATFNVEGAVVISNNWSLHLPIKLNPWKFNDRYYRRLAMMPGARYWLINSYSRGMFVGINAIVSAYDRNGLIGNNYDYFARDFRYKGLSYGGGLSCGYSIPVSRRWNIEFEGGIAAVHAEHDLYYTFDQNDKSVKVGTQKGLLFVPNKIGVNVVYLF